MSTIQRRKTTRRLARNAGITLIEMLVVVTIIALFSSIAYQRLTPALEQGRRTAAQTQIENLSAALQRFNIDYARFPTEEEGFSVLQPYLTKEIPPDPWKRPYIYRYPGDHGPEPDVMSYGADGEEGGEGPNTDIVSWRGLQ
ncbi:MAG: type II secretion system major pseudopilin GspG [Acidobacteria bacterium]|nr:type II secretion system major pseudopilin GspG [Acidobacteriota bacterium]